MPDLLARWSTPGASATNDVGRGAPLLHGALLALAAALLLLAVLPAVGWALARGAG
jgi:hypothetical protein